MTAATLNKVIELRDDSHCFVCGGANVNGLQLKWKTEGNKSVSEFFPARAHQGWQGVVHGGILAAILDEAMTRTAWQRYGSAVTGEMTVRYMNPARIGEKLTVTGEVDDSKSRLIPTRAEIRNTGGQIVASATGKAVKYSQKAS